MSYQFTREEHSLFYERELSAQTDAFKQVLGTEAAHLLQIKEELYAAQYITYRNGELILKFSNNRMFPRIGEFLYCFVVSKEYRNYKNWGGISYQELLSQSVLGTETHCVWISNSEEEGYSLLGFRGMAMDFVDATQQAGKIVVFLGPNPPPFEYLLSLQQVVSSFQNSRINAVLDLPLSDSYRAPTYLNINDNITSTILAQSQFEDIVVIQGPPGTGKSHLIAELCDKLCARGHSVLITALTNRALVEVAHKTPLANLLQSGKVYKNNLTYDEQNEIPGLQYLKELQPMTNSLVLSTFYYSSKVIASNKVGVDVGFDYVIVDEASQALLATLGVARLLGRKNIWIGDTAQLPPVTAISNDIVKKRNFNFFIEGLKVQCSSLTSYPLFSLTKSYRLTDRAANYTGLFYNNSLSSFNDVVINWGFLDLEISRLFHQGGGPTLIKLPLQKGIFDDFTLIRFVAYLAYSISKAYPDRHLSILSQSKITVKSLQKAIKPIIGKTENLLIETVARVQGLTTDLTIYVVPASGYHRSLEAKLFNVATSRSRMNTLIISSKDIFTYQRMSDNVSKFLRKLNEEFSFDFSSGSDSRYNLDSFYKGLE